MDLFISGEERAISYCPEQTLRIIRKHPICRHGCMDIHHSEAFKLLTAAHLAAQHVSPGMLKPSQNQLDRCIHDMPREVFMVNDPSIMVPFPIELVKPAKENSCWSWVKMLRWAQDQGSQHWEHLFRNALLPEHHDCLLEDEELWVTSWRHLETLQD